MKKKMVFNNLKVKRKLYNKALKEFRKCSREHKDFSCFKSGYHGGFNDCLKWIINIFGVEDVGQLKNLSTELKKPMVSALSTPTLGTKENPNKLDVSLVEDEKHE